MEAKLASSPPGWKGYGPPYDESPLPEESDVKARIGIAESSKVIEIEVGDADEFRNRVEQAFRSEQEVYWFTDLKKRSVGVPIERIAFVEIDPEDGDRRVGFAP